MNLRGTSIGKIQQLESALYGLKLTFESKEDADIDGLRKIYGLMKQIHNQLNTLYEELAEEGIDVREKKAKFGLIMQKTEARLKNLGILN